MISPGQRLWLLLDAYGSRFGAPPEPAKGPEWSCAFIGKSGAIGFYEDLLAVAIPRGDVAATRQALRLIRARLGATGSLRSLIWHRNWPSIRAARKLGAKPVGVTRDNFICYQWKLEDYPYGQEVPAPTAGPQADL